MIQILADLFAWKLERLSQVNLGSWKIESNLSLQQKKWEQPTDSNTTCKTYFVKLIFP